MFFFRCSGFFKRFLSVARVIHSVIGVMGVLSVVPCLGVMLCRCNNVSEFCVRSA